MSAWFKDPATGRPELQPDDLIVGSVLESPKGSRWTIAASDRRGRGGSFLLRDEHGLTAHRSYQQIRSWLLIHPLNQTS